MPDQAWNITKKEKPGVMVRNKIISPLVLDRVGATPGMGHKAGVCHTAHIYTMANLQAPISLTACLGVLLEPSAL